MHRRERECVGRKFLLVIVVCTSVVHGGKKSMKKPPKWGPINDLGLCQQICVTVYNECVVAALNSPIISKEGIMQRVEVCDKKRIDCFKSCKKAYPIEGS